MMAMYQLCRAKAAKHPFYIESIDINIYTIEELCFYLWKNVSLLDESILNEKLCDWLEGELGMQRLAFHLREKLICWSITACIPGRSAFTVRSCKTAIRGKQGFSFMQAY